MKKGYIFSLVTLILIFLQLPSKVAVSDTESENLGMKYYLTDNYTDDVIETLSQFYLNGDNTLGAPDGLFATILLDYSNSILTLDMGINEEIINGLCDDFFVRANVENYTIKISKSLSSPFLSLALDQEMIVSIFQ